MPWQRRSNKFNVASKSNRTCDGVVFDSKGEMERFLHLKMLHRAGKISSLERQVRFPLDINGVPIKTRSEGFPNGRKCVYTADFVYFENGVRVVEEYKGFDTAESRFRRAVFEAIYKVEVTVTR